MKYSFQNVFQRDVSQFAQYSGKLRDFKYLSRFSVINVLWYLKDVRAVFMYEILILSEIFLKLTRPSQIAQLLSYLRSFFQKNYLLYFFVIIRCEYKISIFWFKSISFLFKNNKCDIKSRSKKPHWKILNIVWSMPKSYFYSVTPWNIMHLLFVQHFHNHVS